MDWANEQYVRLYVRNTTTWRRLGFEGQTMLMHLLRVLDRSGVLDIEDMSPAEAAALHTGAPADFAEVGMSRLLSFGTFVHDGQRLVMPRFIEAQEATKSDKQRQKESRERRAVTKRDDRSQNVTESHVQSQPVTSGHSVLCSALPCSALLSEAEEERAVTRADFGGGKAIREVSREPSAAARGAAMLSRWTGQEPFSHSGKWANALAELASKPESERAIAGRVLVAEAGKPDVVAKLTPQHVIDYWHLYREGKAPGKKGDPEAQQARSNLSTFEAELAAARAARKALSEEDPDYASKLYDADRAVREAIERRDRAKRLSVAASG